MTILALRKGRNSLFTAIKTLLYKMKTKTKEIRKDLYTKAEYAKLVGLTPARVGQMAKSGELSTLTVNGTVLIKND